ncbi:hypothetical protein [Roseibium sp. RKSG952]|nr:hypothetical protein [Roseibium sp. RKSG952]
MLKRFAKQRQTSITQEIAGLVDRVDSLSEGEYQRLKSLDRSYQFWRRFN